MKDFGFEPVIVGIDGDMYPTKGKEKERFREQRQLRHGEVGQTSEKEVQSC